MPWVRVRVRSSLLHHMLIPTPGHLLTIKDVRAIPDYNQISRRTTTRAAGTGSRGGTYTKMQGVASRTVQKASIHPILRSGSIACAIGQERENIDSQSCSCHGGVAWRPASVHCPGSSLARTRVECGD